MTFIELIGLAASAKELGGPLAAWLKNTDLDSIYLSNLKALIKQDWPSLDGRLDYNDGILTTRIHALNFQLLPILPDMLTEAIGKKVQAIILDKTIVYGAETNEQWAQILVRSLHELYSGEVAKTLPHEWSQIVLRQNSAQNHEVLKQLDEIRKKVSPPTHLFLDSTTVRMLFGPYVQLIDLSEKIPATDEEVLQYFKGERWLSWEIIAAQGYVERDQFNELVDSAATPSDQTQMLCLTGEMGAGKSSLAWRVAAEVSRKLGYPLLHVLNNEADEIWYQIEYGLQQLNMPAVVLVDDIFRGPDTRRALEALPPSLKLVIIATSRPNEIPRNLRLRFSPAIKELTPPNQHEKELALTKLGRKLTELNKQQRQRLENANSWLVLMHELVTGEALSKSVSDALTHLKRTDEVVYRAYEYLAFLGQYDLPVSESLISALDENGRFYNLLDRPTGKGFIFTVDRLPGFLRAQHAVIAKEAFENNYSRDPTIVIKELIEAAQPKQISHRIIIGLLLRQLTFNQQQSVVKNIINNVKAITNVVYACGCGEIVFYWIKIYGSIGNNQMVTELEETALSKPPETIFDFHALFKLTSLKGTGEQVSRMIDTTFTWLHANQQDIHVRAAFLGLIEHNGTTEQINQMIDTTFTWLQVNQQDNNVREAFMGLVERKGNRQQINQTIDTTFTWLHANQHDSNTRATFMGLVERKGNHQQINQTIDTTFTWLHANQHDMQVRGSFIGLVERNGTAEQINQMIDTTFTWLHANQHDVHVRAAFMGLVERNGTAEQINQMIDTTFTWLHADQHDVHVRAAFMGLVERNGTAEQINQMIDTTFTWLHANRQDTNVRAAFMGLVERNGTAEQINRTIDTTFIWLHANRQDTNSRAAFIGLIEQKGTGEQIEGVLALMEVWFTNNQTSRNSSLFTRYASLLFKKEQYFKSEIWFRRALAINPMSFLTHFGLVWSLYYQGNNLQALKNLKYLLQWAQRKRKSELGAVLHELGLYFRLENNLPQAIKYFEAAIKESPYYYGNYWELGLTWFALEKYPEAFEAFENAKQQLPTNVSEKIQLELEGLIESTRAKLRK